MAIYYARANGNVNATNVWSTTVGGATSDLFPSFTNADTLMANGFTVTLNVNTTVLEIRNDNANGATVGGKFNLNTGVTLTANIVAGAATCVTAAGTSNIVGSLTATGTGAVVDGSFGTLTITGNITSSPTSSTGYGVQQYAGVVNVTGNVTAQSAVGIISNGNTINITGNITGGTSSGMSNFFNATIVGIATGGTTGAGVSHTTAGTCTVTRAKGGSLSSSAVGVAGSSTGFTRVEEIEYGDLGASPVSGRIILTDKTSNVAIMYRFGTTKKTLTDATAISGLIPSTNDVRRNIIYNGGNNVGTMDVPASASVALGVSVDNTTGTAILTSGNIGDIWNYPVSGISVSNSIGERLKNCSTVATMGSQLAAALNNV